MRSLTLGLTRGTRPSTSLSRCIQWVLYIVTCSSIASFGVGCEVRRDESGESAFDLTDMHISRHLDQDVEMMSGGDRELDALILVDVTPHSPGTMTDMEALSVDMWRAPPDLEMILADMESVLDDVGASGLDMMIESPDADPLPEDMGSSSSDMLIVSDDMEPPLIDCERGDGVVYVSAYSVQGIGSATSPFTTITEALTALRDQGGGTIKVGVGRYEETVVVPDEVHIMGGYDEQWNRADEPSIIIGQLDQEGRAIGVIAEDIECGSALSSLHIETVMARPGQSSYGVVARRASALRLSEVVVTAGPGGQGASGLAGASGEDGVQGHVGRVVTDEYGCELFVQGGASGYNEACPLGTAGGRADPWGYLYAPIARCYLSDHVGECPLAFGVSGFDGRTGVLDLYSEPIGAWWPATDHYLAWSGGDGQDGQHGLGQSPAYSAFLDDEDVGVGGGGSGGCGGQGGTGGRAGGSSVGLFALDSPGLMIEDSEITGGERGLGGRGAAGGAGGAGGLPGDQLTCELVSVEVFDCDFMGFSCSTQGVTPPATLVEGGGGMGGSGGHGGDGAHGVSIGMRCWGGEIDWDEETVIASSTGELGMSHIGCCVSTQEQRRDCERSGDHYQEERCTCLRAPRCDARPETCNQVDDDCDGVIDEDALGVWRPLIATSPNDAPYLTLHSSTTAEASGVILSLRSPNFADEFEPRGAPNVYGLKFDGDGARQGFMDHIGDESQIADGVMTRDRMLIAVDHGEGLRSVVYGITPTDRYVLHAPLGHDPDYLGVSAYLDQFDELFLAGSEAIWSRYDHALELMARRAFTLSPQTPHILDSLGTATELYMVSRGADVQGNYVRWSVYDTAGHMRIVTHRRPGEISSVKMIRAQDGEVYTLWSERRAEERRTWIAHHLSHSEVEVAEVGNGTLIEVLNGSTDDELVLIKRHHRDLIVGRWSGGAYRGDRREPDVFLDHNITHVIKLGDRLGLLVKTEAGVMINQSTLCSP